MKNIRKFETTVDMEAAVLEDVSVTYNAETDRVHTTHENGGVLTKLTFNMIDKYDDVETTPPIIVEYQAISGMTWEDFVNSDFNPTCLHEENYNENQKTFICQYYGDTSYVLIFDENDMLSKKVSTSAEESDAVSPYDTIDFNICYRALIYD